ncbi:MAG: MFS transporter [Chlamydiae bacterium]|nr:MFS transporter [Chlamydiota bacterium]
MLRLLFRSSFGKSLIVIWFAHMVMDFFTGIWPIYKTLAQIDLAKAGLIAGISGFFGEILQLGFGYFSDKGYRKKILLLGLILSSFILWITFTTSFQSCFILLLLLMMGSGAFHPAGVGYCGSFSKDHKGKCILFFSSGGALGLGISQITFTKLFHSFNGHALILFIPVILTLLVVAIHKFPETCSISGTFNKNNFLAPFKTNWKRLSLLYFTQLSCYLVGAAFIFLLPDLMIAKTSNTWLIMGGAHLSFILGSAIALPFVGFLCDKYGQKKILPFFIVGTFCLFYVLLNTSTLSIPILIILLFSLGAFFQSINPIIVSWGNKIVPDSPSTVSGLLMGCAWCFTSFGPACAGLLCKRFAETAIVSTLNCMGFLLIFSLLFSLMIRENESEELCILDVLEKNESETIPDSSIADDITP